MSDDDFLSQGLLANSRTVVDATYRRPELPKFAGIPTIEALPLTNTREQALDGMQRLPEYSDKMRRLPAQLRTHAAMDVLHFFQPLPIHLKLEGMVSRMIRDGYLSRNPLNPAQSDDLKTRQEHYKQCGVYGDQFAPSGCGFTICGMSGVGKTTALIRVLNLYPQIIIHSNYKGKRFTRVQLTWLILECPKDGSTKALCTRFFKTIDYVMGGTTAYAKKFGSKNRTTNDLMDSMANVAATHLLGALVIDEIQYLSVAKSGGADEMLNFFVDLVNTIGLPVIIVGTYDAIPLLTSTFRKARRGSGQGDLVWDPMPFDESWQLFAESLWRYQYVREKCPLTGELSSALHEISYGIADIANRIYLAAQVRAIENGSERITEGLLRSAYRDDFRLVSHIIETLLSGEEALAAHIKDVHPPPIVHVQTTPKKQHNSVGSDERSDPTEDSTNNTGPKPSTEGSPSTHTKPASGGSRIAPPGKSKTSAKRTSSRKRKFSTAVDSFEENDLRGIIARGLSSSPQVDAYSALLNASYIKNSAEFLTDESNG